MFCEFYKFHKSFLKYFTKILILGKHTDKHKKQNVNNIDSKRFFNLGFIFDTTGLLAKLGNVLKRFKVDCVIIDAIADLYSGDMNQANKIRSFIYQFQQLADKHKTLFIFLHHTKKGSQYSPPSKDNVLGSQGFEAKMRLVLEIRKDFKNPELRYLCIVKGNYVPESMKQDAMVLKFDENMLFTSLNRTVPFSELAQNKDSPNSKFEKAKRRAVELKQRENLSINEILTKLREEGLAVARSTVANWIRDIEPSSGLYEYEDPEDHIHDLGELEIQQDNN